MRKKGHPWGKEASRRVQGSGVIQEGWSRGAKQIQRPFPTPQQKKKKKGQAETVRRTPQESAAL